MTVLPLPFQGDLIDYLKVHGREIAWLWRDGKAYIPARPICEIMGLSWSRQRKVLTGPDSEACVALWATHDASGRRQEMLCVAYEDFLIWMAGVSIARVNPEAREPLRRLKTEIKLVLAAHYHDRLLGERTDAVVQLQGFVSEYISLKPIRSKVRDAVRDGWTWAMLVGATSYPQWRLLNTIRDLIRIGAIDRAPEGAPLNGGEPRQLSLFPEGAGHA